MTVAGSPMRKLNVNQVNVLCFLDMGWTLVTEHPSSEAVASYIKPDDATEILGASVWVRESDLAVLKKRPKLIGVLRMDRVNRRTFYRLTPAGIRELAERRKRARTA